MAFFPYRYDYVPGKGRTFELIDASFILSDELAAG
jgi:hypothetical protein